MKRGILLTTLAVVAGCGGGGGGNGGAEPPGSVTVSGCTIAGNAMTCPAAVAWSTTKAGQPRLTANGAVISTAPSGNQAVPVGHGDTVFRLEDGGVVIASATARAGCESASAWDAQRCLPFAIRHTERAATPFVENGQPVTLEVVFFTPLAGTPPWPAVIFNHGSTGNGSDPSLFRQTFTSEPIAKFFADRGWMVAFPQRRGRGQSDGLYDEGFLPDRSAYSCVAAQSLPGFDRALADLDAATDHLRARPDVDTARFVEAGTSRGGILSIAHVAGRPADFRGAINFVGGWLGEGCGEYLVVNRNSFVRGAGFPRPTLWLYAENDTFYTVAHSRANFDAFIAAGGQGSFQVYTRAPGFNGHFLINDPVLWAADVESYIAN